jgi:hypothetical protein
MARSTHRDTELAQRSSDGIEVTLVWVQENGEDEAVVTVYDARKGEYFEIRTESHLALEVYYHPFAYRDYTTIDHPRIAA